METFDGITDITVSAYYAQLDRLHPDAKFVLTVREEESWLRSCEAHWSGREAFEDAQSQGRRTHMRIRRFLRTAVYGTYQVHQERFRYVMRKHVDDVRQHFAGRPGKLLELDIVGGAGWEPLCAFLDRPHPVQPFPHKGSAASAKLRREIGDPDD